MKIEQDIASEEYEDLLTRVESVEKITSGMNIGGNVDLGNVFARGLITGIFRSGDGIKDVDLDGFQMDGDELVGQASGVDQVVLSGSTGLLTAGAGAVTLDADGITLAEGTGATNAIKWTIAGATDPLIFGTQWTDYNRLQLTAYSDATHDAEVVLGAFGTGGATDWVDLAITADDGIVLGFGAGFGGSQVVAITGGTTPLQFNDSSTEIWEDGSSNLSFKDANAGTLTLAQLSNKKIVMGAPTELTIASGVITVTQSYHQIDTESDDATDDLNTINGGVNGMILILRSANAARDTTVKDGADNIQLDGNADFALNTMRDRLMLMYDAGLSLWVELSRSSN